MQGSGGRAPQRKSFQRPRDLHGVAEQFAVVIVVGQHPREKAEIIVQDFDIGMPERLSLVESREEIERRYVWRDCYAI